MSAPTLTSTAPLTADELATHLRISVATVRRRCRAGEWPARRIGRTLHFTPEHVARIERLLEAPPPRRPRRARTKDNDIARALEALASG